MPAKKTDFYVNKYTDTDLRTLLEAVQDEIARREEANAREIYYIQLYKSNNPEFGYNTQAGGEQSGNYEYL